MVATVASMGFETRIAAAVSKLQEFLDDNDITLREAAAAIGVGHPTILDWLGGRKRPRAHHRDAIAKWTGGRIHVESWLFAEEKATTVDVVPFKPKTKETKVQSGGKRRKAS